MCDGLRQNCDINFILVKKLFNIFRSCDTITCWAIVHWQVHFPFSLDNDWKLNNPNVRNLRFSFGKV